MLRGSCISQTARGDEFEKTSITLLLSGQAFDVFAVDVYNHKTCYLSFYKPYKSSKVTEMNKDELTRINVLRNKVNDKFLTLIERKVIKDKEAYLTTDFLEEYTNLSTENGLD